MSDVITVQAGHHPRVHCPLRIPWSDAEAPSGLSFGSSVVPVQKDGDHLVFIPLALDAGESAVYSPGSEPEGGGVTLEDSGEAISVHLDNEPFTTYRYRGVPARPYFWPVLAPGGIPVTRAWPMQTDVPGETHDHRHHRSMYFAFGSVNGADNWSEEEGHGFTIHRSVDEQVSGPVFGRFATTSDWTDADRKKILAQKATVTIWRGSHRLRMMDVDMRLTADPGDVLFGDTKEGGLLTVRVASSMDVPRGGRIENAYGGVNEPETWGYSAHWCDYSGTVEGQQVGITVMDHPASFRYPTYWHVRDYGLMAANPFALHDYTGGQKEGSHLLKAGETLRFVYRVIIHRGDASAADLRHRYLDFVAPPRVSLEG
jgi:hypothetical protein